MTDRERLIELLEDTLHEWESDVSVQTLTEIAEHLIENGVIVPPCKVGDYLYTNSAMQGWYMRKRNAPYRVKIVFIGLNDSEKMGGGVLHVLYENDWMLEFPFSDIGKTIFLTYEEAKRLLKERD